MPREYLCLYHSYLGSADSLSDRELGRLIRAALTYSAAGTEPDDLPRNLRPIYAMIREQIDRDRAKYAAKCAQNSRNISGYWDSRRESAAAGYERIRTNTNVYKEKGKEERDLPPCIPPRGGRGRRKGKREIPQEHTNAALEQLETNLSGGQDGIEQ